MQSSQGRQCWFKPCCKQYNGCYRSRGSIAPPFLQLIFMQYRRVAKLQHELLWPASLDLVFLVLRSIQLLCVSRPDCHDMLPVSERTAQRQNEQIPQEGLKRPKLLSAGLVFHSPRAHLLRQWPPLFELAPSAAHPTGHEVAAASSNITLASNSPEASLPATSCSRCAPGKGRAANAATSHSIPLSASGMIWQKLGNIVDQAMDGHPDIAIRVVLFQLLSCNDLHIATANMAGAAGHVTAAARI